MPTFAKFVSDYLHIKEQMSTDLEISVPIIERWATGTANPHPLIKSAVWTYLCNHQLREHNLIHLRDEVVKRVEDVLRAHDPQGLIRMGAPPDEYSSEAEQAAYHLFSCKSCHSFQKALWAIFALSFDVRSAGDIKDYEKMAEEIWPIKEEEKYGKL